MARHTSHTSFDTNDEAFDLSHIFIGREQQLDLFKIYLDRWQQHMFNADLGDTIITTAPSPNNKIQGLVVLLYGRGGFGKSTLLRRYRDIVLTENQNLLPGQSAVTVSSIVDWEFAIEGKRGLFNPPAGQEIDAAAYFQALCGQLAISLDKNPKEFKEYQSAVKDVDKARKDASGVLDSMQKDDRYAWLRGLTVEAIRGAVRTYIPGSGVVVDNPSVKAATDEAAKLTQEQISRVHDRLRDKLGNKLGDYLDAALRLGLALGHDLHDFARNVPLLICFDTYEEIDEGDRLLRIVMGAAGLRVGWVLAGRDNLWAGPGQTDRSIAVEYGYKEIVPADRGLAIDFNAGGVGAFTLSDIKDYFDLLCKKVWHHLQLPQVNEGGAKRILDVTGGVPLAVKIAAGLYMETGKLGAVTETVEGKRAIVDQMVRRYLLHARDNEDERARLYGLAMLRRADQPLAVVAALGLSAEEAATSYASALSRLHRHYSFIFTEKEEPALYQEVRHFLRLWLLEHRKDPEIAVMNERLKAAHEDTLKKLEGRRQYATLQERLQDEEWTGIYLDVVEQQFWLDPVDGVRCMLPFMIAAAIYSRTINEDAAKVGKFFETSVRSPYRTWWTWAALSLVYTISPYPSPDELAGLEELEKLTASQRCPSFAPPLLDYRGELEGALWWRLGEAYLSKDDAKALAWYEKALTRLGQQIELKEAAAVAARNVAYTLYREKKYAEMIPLLNRSVELNPSYAVAYNNRGYAYANLRDYQCAIQDFDRTIALDPNYTLAYNNRGYAYANLRHYQCAIQDFDRATALDPDYAAAYHNRGLAYAELKDYQHAIQDYDCAIALDPNLAFAYHNRGIAYAELKDYQCAIQDFDRAIALDPDYAAAYHNRGLAYAELKDYQHAIQDFDRAIAFDPNYTRVRNNRGVTYENPKEYQRAIQDYDHTIELAPDYAAAYHNRGLAYAELKDYQHAIQDYGCALALDPNLAAAYHNRGIAHHNLKEYQRAIQDFDRTLELDPNYALAYSIRGFAYLWLKNVTQAMADYNHSYELDPKEVNATWMREWAGMNKQRPGLETATRLEALADTGPQQYAAFVCRGVASGLRSKVKEGLVEVDRAIPLKPKEPDAYFWKGMLCAYYGGQARIEEARAMIEQALSLGLPPVLLTPLYWLEKDRPDFFEKYARPLLEQYRV